MKKIFAVSENLGKKRVFDPGRELFRWTAHDYHPHDRGLVWFAVFFLVIFGGAFWAMFSGDWVMATTFFGVAAFYFWAHRTGPDFHEVQICENGLLVDGRKFYAWERFSGFWFVYDSTVSVVNFQFVDRRERLSLQMGEVSPEVFRRIFEKAEFPELPNKKEGVLDLWIRALKL